MSIGRPREFEEREALERAMEVFWEKGYSSAGLRELLDATGLARQSLYNTFGDKRGLFFRVLRHYADTVFQERATQLQETGSALRNLREMIRSWASTDSLKRGCLICNSLAEFGQHDAEFTAFVEEITGRFQGLLFETLERAKAAGELSAAANSQALAAMIFACSLGCSVMRRAGAPPDRIELAAEQVIAMLA